MSAFPNSPRLLKAGLVLVDANSGVVQRVIILQYNPDSLTRTLQAQTVRAETQNRLEALRLTGPAIETFKLEAEIDAADQLEFPDQNPLVTQFGIHPQLAAFETVVYPPSSQLLAANRLAQSGVLEIAPVEAPLSLFVWSRSRIIPVRISDFSITEEAFDPNLNPIRARVSLGMRVLNVNDLGFNDKGGNIFMAYMIQKEVLSGLSAGTLGALGLESI
ncbi:MAG: hypothetical protein JO121_24810 [Deltaproteobacteria bacterium]|jgi:hypothetical protein|nr:hypothetical protein [Deltaproteobacteria bacterium]